MIVSKDYRITGMYCSGCEAIIEDSLRELEGIQYVKADYRKASVKISFDPNKISIVTIKKSLDKLGYSLELQILSQKPKILKIILSILALLCISAIIILSRKYGFFSQIPELNSQTTDWMIFVVGLLTGLHCVGMCGSFIIGYTAKDSMQGCSIFHSHILYGTGKTLSYAIIGAIFGLFGSLFRITPLIGGISIGLAGAFLIIYGLNMLNIFSFLKFIRIKQPKFIMRFVTDKKHRTNNPLFIGLFSGLILGCGPLQVMYVMAAGTGNALVGAKILALFGLGTLPALFTFGLLTRFLSNTMTRRFLQASGIILIILGTIMLLKGITRAGSPDEPTNMEPKCHCHSCSALTIEEYFNSNISLNFNKNNLEHSQIT
jgi:sulfite exporter TauE/SafE/copper chaperone CopZ